jgi:hypothetical protein
MVWISSIIVVVIAGTLCNQKKLLIVFSQFLLESDEVVNFVISVVLFSGGGSV